MILYEVLSIIIVACAGRGVRRFAPRRQPAGSFEQERLMREVILSRTWLPKGAAETCNPSTRRGEAAILRRELARAWRHLLHKD